jgi:methyl-accepting chemotaxis protein
VATTITITVDGDHPTIIRNVVPPDELSGVLQALRDGDFTARATSNGNDDVTYHELINVIMAQHQRFTAEVTRLTQELGTRGVLGGQIELTAASGEWRNLLENINVMSATLTTQLRSMVMVVEAAANGDYSRRLTVEASGETAELRDAINRFIERLAAQSGAAERTNRNAASSLRAMPKLSGANEMETTIEVFDEIEPGND